MLLAATARVSPDRVRHVVITREERICNVGIYLLSRQRGIEWETDPSNRTVRTIRQPMDLWMDADGNTHIRQWDA
jgi:hypothetical protein